jgi:predicted acyltransferase
MNRVAAIDAFRGFTMVMMISEGFGILRLQDLAWLRPIASQFEHAEWEGMRFWDLIQPFFMFIVGVVMPWSVEPKLAAGENVWPKVFRRSALLIFWGLVARSIRSGRPVVDVINVLAQIAFTYPIAVAVARIGFARQLIVALALLAFHAAIYIGFGNPWTVGENLGEAIDRAVFGKNWGGHYATINFVSSAANTIFGVMAGQMIRAGALSRLAGFGGALLAAGLAISPWIPIIKKTWTASFALASGGLTIFALLAFWWMVEERGWKLTVFTIVGANSIFIYLFHEILEKWLTETARIFTGWGSPVTAPGMLALTDLLVVAFQIWVCVWLWRRRIFFKL